MSFFEKLIRRSLTTDELRSIAMLCGSMAVLIAVAVFFGAAPAPLYNSSSQAAATWLADQQNLLPPPNPGYPWPDYTNCYVNYNTGYGMPYTQCSGNQDYFFYSAVFSVHPEGSTAGQSLFVYNYFSRGTYQQDVYAGPANVTYHCYDADLFEIPCGGEGQVSSPAYDCNNIPIPPGDEYVQIVFENDGNSSFYSCYGYKYGPSTVNPYVSGPTGPTPHVAPGGPLTLEWSCMDQRTVFWKDNVGATWYRESQEVTGIDWRIDPLTTNATASYWKDDNYPGSLSTIFDYGPGGLLGSQTIAAPMTPGSYHYRLDCPGPAYTSWWAMDIPVVVDNVAITPPTATITSSAGDTIQVNQSTTLTASDFTVGSGDSLIQTCVADNDNACLGSAHTSSPWDATYVFTPSAAGSYIFYAHALSTSYLTEGSSANYASKTITVNPVAGPALTYTIKKGLSGSEVISINASLGDTIYETWNTTGGTPIVSGTYCYIDNNSPCTNLGSISTTGTYTDNVTAANGWVAGHTYTTRITVTDADGRTANRSTTIAVNGDCSDPTIADSSYPDCNVCVSSGYVYQGGTCVAIPQPSLSVLPTSVRSGLSVTVSWNITNVSSSGETSCNISSSPSVLNPEPLIVPHNNLSEWSGSKDTSAITSKTVFTLSCTNADPVSATVNLIPTVIEI